MSRVHDALRKAAHENPGTVKPVPNTPKPLANVGDLPLAHAASTAEPFSEPLADGGQLSHSDQIHRDRTAALLANSGDDLAPANDLHPAADLDRRSEFNRRSELEHLEEVIANVQRFPFTPAPDALLVDPSKPKDAPSEEFRSLRTRLNHLQTTQPLHTLVVSSASPGEGKSFTASNLAMSQAQLAGKRVLLADFDFRRPTVGKLFGLHGAPGLSDYLLGRARVQDIMHRLGDSNLYVIPAGQAVSNPLELLNLKECSALLEALRDHFDWVILDSPPLLFAADGNLLSTMADGTILVVRIGTTTYDSVARAIQSLCENNVLGIVVNGANRGELYSRYSYYHSYYYGADNKAVEPGRDLELDPVSAEKV